MLRLIPHGDTCNRIEYNVIFSKDTESKSHNFNSLVYNKNIESIVRVKYTPSREDRRKINKCGAEEYIIVNRAVKSKGAVKSKETKKSNQTHPPKNPDWFDSIRSTMFGNDREIIVFSRMSNGKLVNVRDSAFELFKDNKLRFFIQQGGSVCIGGRGINASGEFVNSVQDERLLFFSSGVMSVGKFTDGNRAIVCGKHLTYEGEARNCLKHGFGIEALKNGEIYEGGWKNGVREGLGHVAYKDGSLHYGHWKDGDYHGFAISSDSKKNLYYGSWKNGMLDGKFRIKLNKKNAKRVECDEITVNYSNGYLVPPVSEKYWKLCSENGEFARNKIDSNGGFANSYNSATDLCNFLNHSYKLKTKHDTREGVDITFKTIHLKDITFEKKSCKSGELKICIVMCDEHFLPMFISKDDITAYDYYGMSKSKSSNSSLSEGSNISKILKRRDSRHADILDEVKVELIPIKLKSKLGICDDFSNAVLINSYQKALEIRHSNRADLSISTLGSKVSKSIIGMNTEKVLENFTLKVAEEREEGGSYNQADNLSRGRMSNFAEHRELEDSRFVGKIGKIIGKGKDSIIIGPNIYLSGSQVKRKAKQREGRQREETAGHIM